MPSAAVKDLNLTLYLQINIQKPPKICYFATRSQASDHCRNLVPY